MGGGGGERRGWRVDGEEEKEERKRKNEEEGIQVSFFCEAKHPKFGGLNKATSISLVPNSGACNLGWAQLDGPDGLSWAHSGAFSQWPVSRGLAQWWWLDMCRSPSVRPAQACLHAYMVAWGSRSSKRANFHVQTLCKPVLVSHLLMSHWAKQLARPAHIRGWRKRPPFDKYSCSHIAYGQAYWDRENLWPFL